MSQKEIKQAIEQVSGLLARCNCADSVMPPTALFNEGWLLRLVLDWHSRHPDLCSPLAFEAGATWYSEGRLSSPFVAQQRVDSRAEKHTCADGFIGHFSVCQKAEIVPTADVTQLIVVEAKLGSGLSKRTKNAPDYDQAARNACCLAHIASEAKLTPSKLKKFAFYVVAPESKFKKFGSLVTRPSIKRKIKKRASDYGKEDGWYEKLEPFVDAMCVKLITWEDILTNMELSGGRAEYRSFYEKCKKYNALVK